MDQGLWREYLKMLDGLGRTLDQLTEIEQKKTEAVSTGDLNGVEECMTREQALSLSLRGFDQKREAMLAKLGIPNTSLQQLEKLSPEGLEMETKRAAEKLRGQYRCFRSASDTARTVLECNLRVIEKMRPQQQEEAAPPPAQQRQYDFRG